MIFTKILQLFESSYTFSVVLWLYLFNFQGQQERAPAPELLTPAPQLLAPAPQLWGREYEWQTALITKTVKISLSEILDKMDFFFITLLYNILIKYVNLGLIFDIMTIHSIFEIHKYTKTS